jgi:four helix bundle protein
MDKIEEKIAYRKLITWQKADELAFQIYRVTKYFPNEEKFCLVSQMRRAALSVAANIAEGYTRNSKKDKVHFYNIALGSLTEIEYYLDFSLRLAYISDKQYQLLVELREEVGRLLNGLTKSTNGMWQETRDKGQEARDKRQGTRSKEQVTRSGLLRGRVLLFFFLVSCPLFLVSIAQASAASLYFSPSSGSYSVGQNLSVGVYVLSPDKAMNAASGVVNFSKENLQLVSLSKSGSIFSLWVQEPSFSNSEGTANFEGIVLNPGFTGNSGKILTLNFKVLKPGKANLSFYSGSVLANDGEGTNILNNLGTASFDLKELAPSSQIVSNLPSAPEIKSPTHPDQNKWYALKDVRLEWDIPENVIEARFVLSQNSSDEPKELIQDNFKEFSNLEDGIWYFALQFKNKNGWGKISRFKIQIDTTPPNPINLTFVDGKQTYNQTPTIIFDTKDNMSGIDFYKIKIGDGDFFDVPAVIVQSNPYKLPFQALGEHTILIQAFDKAGNYSYVFDKFTILSPPSSFKIFSDKLLNILVEIIPIIGLILLLILMILYGIWYIKRIQRKIKKDITLTKQEIHKIFEFLKKETESKIKILEETRSKRQLTEEEEKIIHHLKSDLENAEKILKEDVEQFLNDTK